MELKRLSINDKEAIKELFTGVFTGEPWNDDWSDSKQLDCYIDDLCGQSYSLTYGLFEGGELIGLSMGYIKHWYTGTEGYLVRLGSGRKTMYVRTDALR